MSDAIWARQIPISEPHDGQFGDPVGDIAPIDPLTRLAAATGGGDWAQAGECAEAAYRWLRNAAWPLWLRHGVDRDRGAFHESLSGTDLSCRAPFRRLRVAARQVYVFCHAAAAGVDDAAEAVEIGLTYLAKVARMAPGRYRRRFDLAGAALDGRLDLYDHAFVLLALATVGRLYGDRALKAEADAIGAFIDTELTHPAGGFAEGSPATLPRRQNPHMHLLEARLAAADAYASIDHFRAAAAVVGFVFDRLYDRKHGAMPEFFDDALGVERIDGRYVVEPGHHAEWVWLLNWYRRLAGRFGVVEDVRTQGVSAALAEFVDRHGIAPSSGALIDEAWSDGTPRARNSRLWPQTERLKMELTRGDARPDRVVSAYRALAPYLIAVPAGLWAEHRIEGAGYVVADCPASSLYHLTCGIVEARDALMRRSINPSAGAVR